MRMHREDYDAALDKMREAIIDLIEFAIEVDNGGVAMHEAQNTLKSHLNMLTAIDFTRMKS